jgi:hypothetical protein
MIIDHRTCELPPRVQTKLLGRWVGYFTAVAENANEIVHIWTHENSAASICRSVENS